jgi:hypothetical protein
MVIVSAIGLEFKEMFSPRRNEEHEENPGKSSCSSFLRGELFLPLVGPLDETMIKARLLQTSPDFSRLLKTSQDFPRLLPTL